MSRAIGPTGREDLEPGDIVAIRDKAGSWHIRRVGWDHLPEGSRHVLLGRAAPTCPTLVISKGRVDADPSVGRLEDTMLCDDLAVRVSAPPYADGYLVVSDTPFIASADDIATMRWRRAVVLDAQEIQDIAAAYSCADLTGALKTAWGESDD